MKGHFYKGSAKEKSGLGYQAAIFCTNKTSSMPAMTQATVGRGERIGIAKSVSRRLNCWWS